MLTLINSLLKVIRRITKFFVCSFIQRLDFYLNNISNRPYLPGYNNSLDGGDCFVQHDDLFTDRSNDTRPIKTN